MPRPQGFAGLNLDAMVQRAKETQRRAVEVQARRDEMKVHGASEDGLVQVTVDGRGRVVDLSINPRAMRHASVSLTEAILAALGKAYEEYDAEADRLIGETLGDPELHEKIKSGKFDAYEYLQSFGLNAPELRGLIK